MSAIDTATNQVVATIPVAAGPHGMAITPDGDRVYVSSDGSNIVSIIDTASDLVEGTILVGKSPHGVTLVTGSYLTKFWTPILASGLRPQGHGALSEAAGRVWTSGRAKILSGRKGNEKYTTPIPVFAGRNLPLWQLSNRLSLSFLSCSRSI